MENDIKLFIELRELAVKNDPEFIINWRNDEQKKYFWEYKGDLERYCNFEKLKPQIQNELPEVLKAWEDYKTSIKMLDIVMDNL